MSSDKNGQDSNPVLRTMNEPDVDVLREVAQRLDQVWNGEHSDADQGIADAAADAAVGTDPASEDPPPRSAEELGDAAGELAAHAVVSLIDLYLEIKAELTELAKEAKALVESSNKAVAEAMAAKQKTNVVVAERFAAIFTKRLLRRPYGAAVMAKADQVLGSILATIMR